MSASKRQEMLNKALGLAEMSRKETESIMNAFSYKFQISEFQKIDPDLAKLYSGIFDAVLEANDKLIEYVNKKLLD